jgi:hypothetical protein
MKRPKIIDMAPLELARFRILQARRSSRHSLQMLETLQPDYRMQQDVIANIAWLKSVLAVTSPTWVSKASLSDCAAVLSYIAGTSGDQPQLLN